MRDPLQRIHNIKLALVAVSVSFVGFALMVFARWLDGQPQLADLAFLPWGEVGTTLFTAGILGIGLDYLLSKDDDERAEERLRRVLTSQAPAMRAAVIDGFAFNAEDLAGVATPDTLDRIIRNSLALRLGDAEFAAETYDDVRDKAITATERWHDAKISIRLSTDRNTSAARVPAYVATIRWEYTTVPTHAVRRFTVVSDRAEYRELMNDSEGMSTWFVRPEGGIDAGSTDAFELVQFSVDGDQKTIRRSTRRHGQSYTAPIGLEHVTAGSLSQLPIPTASCFARKGISCISTWSNRPAMWTLTWTTATLTSTTSTCSTSSLAVTRPVLSTCHRLCRNGQSPLRTMGGYLSGAELRSCGPAADPLNSIRELDPIARSKPIMLRTRP